jgi:hypothetical protein
MASKTTQVRQQTWTKPVVAGNTGVHAAITLPASGTTVVTTSITNPDFPRTIRLKSNASTVDGLVVTVAGTDILGAAISEDVTMGATATPTDTVNAFATVTTITVPTRGASGDTVSVGPGPKLGLDCYCDGDSFCIGSAKITSFTNDTAVISKNTILHATTLDGNTNVSVGYIPSTFSAYGRPWG